MDSAGKWALFRSIHNKRGDKSTGLARQASIEDIGIRLGLRPPPYVQAHNDGNLEHFDLLGHAHLLAEGARWAWEKDTKQENKCVQLSVRTPIVNCTEVVQVAPAVVCEFYVDYGNIGNDKALGTTFMEVFRSTMMTMMDDGCG